MNGNVSILTTLELTLHSTISLHDERQEHALLFPVPSPNDVLPSVLDSDYEQCVGEMSASSTGLGQLRIGVVG